MTVSEIRATFFDFFRSKGHEIVPSAPMVVKDDPTLMFVNAGMNQFKDLFLGNAIPKFRRVANSQKCLRVSGKHNDLEEVGVDTYHHTMFEMLGNWSFGDYFKEEAISWAWELLTEVYKLPKDRLYVTIFEGDANDGVPKDEESYLIWKRFIEPERILLASKKDNFWEMGDTGPCGPCTEIHIDLRSETDRALIAGRDLVNADHPQVIEIWNNVFMEFNRKADSSLEPLPEKHVDTGMGLERLAVALQQKTSNYDTDLFQTLIRQIEKQSGFNYGQNESVDIAMRVIADHIRAISFSIADGQLPSNTGAGYVIRRILRRAVRYGYQTLNLKESFMADLSSVLADVMGIPFEELISQRELVYKVIAEEETSFFRTLEQGLKRMQAVIANSSNVVIDGKVVFELYDTYGFPLDLTALIARENGLSIDEEVFERELKIQKDRSRAATAMETDDWMELLEDTYSEFIGYDQLEAPVKIVKYRKVTQKQQAFYQVVFNLTPFYPEGGGQVGDCGYIELNGDKWSIIDTKKENNLIIHLMKDMPKTLGATFNARVDHIRRLNTARNHSATHLLHHALRAVLGKHVEQKGSMVGPDYLRFDFSHFEKISDDQLSEVQSLVSTAIRSNVPLDEKRAVPMEEAKGMGAMALFGEKYGDAVRVIRFGSSIELCGGTHVSASGEIGIFVIKSEAAVAAGVRRIEAITGEKAENYYLEKAGLIDRLNTILKHPKDMVKGVTDLLDENQRLRKELDDLNRDKAKQIKAQLKSQIEQLNGMNLLVAEVELDAASVKDILFQLKSENEPFAGVIGAVSDDKCSLSVILSDRLLDDRKLNAGQLVKNAAALIQGGGGGQAFFATAGGKRAAGLPEALAKLRSEIENGG